MLYELLSATHPTYDSNTWDSYDALYRGGKFFRARISKFLLKNLQEPDINYAQRVKSAHYRSYAGSIVNYFASQLMASPLTIRAIDEGADEINSSLVTAAPETLEDPYYSKLKEDFDGVGTDLVDFARAAFRRVLVKQSVWLLGQLPSNDGVAPVNLQDWKDRDMGAVTFSMLEPECVLDWQHGDDGQLLWAITYQCCEDRKDITVQRGTKRMTWKVYGPEEVETFEYLLKPGDPPLQPDTPIPSTEKAKHGFTVVPLLRFAIADGLWLMNILADSQIEHFRLSSALSWAIQKTCYAMPIFKTSTDKAPVMGAGYYMMIPQGDDMIWSAPPSDPFDVVSKTIDTTKDEIYRVSQQLAQGVDNNAAAVGRSGESKLADASATEVVLKAYGAIVREIIERAFDLAANGRQDNDLTFAIEGLEKFNLEDADVVVKNAVTAVSVGIPSPTFKKELFAQTAEALLPGLDQVKKDMIRNEIDSGVDQQLKEADEAKKALADAMANPQPVAPGQPTGAVPPPTGATAKPTPNAPPAPNQKAA